MTTIQIPQNIILANEDMVPRCEQAIINLNALAAKAGTEEEQERLNNKSDGVRATLEAQRERFQNMKDNRDVAALAVMIEIVADGKHLDGVKLVQGYLMEYVR